MDIANYGMKFDRLDETFSVKVIEHSFDHFDLYVTVFELDNLTE